MVSFVSWMHDQEKREQDPVGWFARYWRDLDGKPRLSSPSSIAKYLEDNGLFQSVNGLTEGYDTTLAEYRHVREGVVREVASGAGVQLPLPEHGPQEPAEPPGQGLAGQAVDRATTAAQQAAQAHGITITPPASMNTGTVVPRRAQMGTGEMLEEIFSRVECIEAKLDRILVTLGLAYEDEPEDLPWADWHQQAVVYALAHGPDWDQAGEGA